MEIDDRLVVQDKLVAVDGSLKRGQEFLAFGYGDVHLLLVDLEMRFPASLGRVHG